MNKNKKEQIEEQEKPETAFQIFVRNYKNVEGFRLLTKAGLYLLFFIVILVGMSLGLGNKGIDTDNNKKSDKNNTTVQMKTTYIDMLSRLLDHKSYSCKASINDKTYIIRGVFGNDILTGTIESVEGTKTFKIADNKIYEIVMEEPTENSTILNDIDTNIIMNNNLVAILKDSSSIKLDGSYKYHKVRINYVDYDIEVFYDENNITAINLTNDTNKYEIKYDA